MSKIEFFTRLYRGAERRLPMTEELGHRIGTMFGLGEGAKVADLVSGSGALARLLAGEFQYEVTCVEADESAIADIKDAAQKDKLDGHITLVHANPAEADFPEGGFQGAVVESARAVGGSVKEAAEKARKLLAENGRLALVTNARVGLNLPEAVAAFYTEKGEALAFPRDLLQELEQAGFEPLSCEAMPETAVDEHFRNVEQALGKAKPGEVDAAKVKREIDIFRREGGRAAVNVLVLIGRRREPGERPPPARGED